MGRVIKAVLDSGSKENKLILKSLKSQYWIPINIRQRRLPPKSIKWNLTLLFYVIVVKPNCQSYNLSVSKNKTGLKKSKILSITVVVFDLKVYNVNTLHLVTESLANKCVNPLPHLIAFWHLCKQSRSRSGSKSCLIRIYYVTLWQYD